MTAADLALVLLCVLAFATFVAMLFTAQALLRATREIQQAAAGLQGETVALIRQLRSTVADAGAEVERVDALLDAADAISSRVDSASRIGYLAFRAPLIRTVAFGQGVRRFLARLIGFGRRPRTARRPV